MLKTQYTPAQNNTYGYTLAIHCSGRHNKLACNIVLLEEAENERMHLMTALELKQPGIIFRGMVLMMQGLYKRACSFSIPSQIKIFCFVWGGLQSE